MRSKVKRTASILNQARKLPARIDKWIWFTMFQLAATEV